jgi:alpha-tubulin suppressor-like RCC1 family protein
MGAFYGAGYNNTYSLGLGDTTARYTFTQLAGDWARVDQSSFDFGAGVKRDGTLWTWGKNTYYQLGQGDTTTRTAPTQVGAGTDWVFVSCGAEHLLALKADGTLWACGRNLFGQTGQSTATNPVTALTRIGVGTDWATILARGGSNYAIKSDGTLWAWGENDYNGLLGIGSTTGSTHAPTQEATASALWVSVSRTRADTDAHCVALRSDGTLWAWGHNAYYQLGQGDTTTRTSPTRVGAGTDWALASAGMYASHAIKTGGTLWGFGRGRYNTFGIAGDDTNKTTPTQIGSATDWTHVIGGNYCQVAINAGGDVWVSGANTYGYLGTGGTGQVTALTKLTLAFTPSGATASDDGIFIGDFEAVAGPPPVPAAATPAPHVYAYSAYISGTEDSLPDYAFELTSFNLSKRSAAVSYYSVSAQFTSELIDSFVARPNGIVYILRDGAAWESFNVSHPIRYDIGPRSSSLSISGTRQETTADAVTIAIEPNMVINQGNNSAGLLTLELVPGYVDPRPADSITWDGDTYLIELVKHQANSGGQTLAINASVV